MNNSIFILLGIILTFIGGLIAYLIYFGHRFLKLQEKKMEQLNKQSTTLSLDELVKNGKLSEDLAQAAREQKQRSNVHAKICSDHPDVPAFKQCALSGEYLCEACVLKQNDVWVAKKYMDLYLESSWQELVMISNSEDNKVNIEKILDKKRDLWSNESLPVIVQDNFKINVENDNIESYIVVLVRPSDVDRVQRALSVIQ